MRLPSVAGPGMTFPKRPSVPFLTQRRRTELMGKQWETSSDNWLDNVFELLDKRIYKRKIFNDWLDNDRTLRLFDFCFMFFSMFFLWANRWRNSSNGSADVITCRMNGTSRPSQTRWAKCCGFRSVVRVVRVVRDKPRMILRTSS